MFYLYQLVILQYIQMQSYWWLPGPGKEYNVYTTSCWTSLPSCTGTKIGTRDCVNGPSMTSSSRIYRPVNVPIWNLIVISHCRPIAQQFVFSSVFSTIRVESDRQHLLIKTHIYARARIKTGDIRASPSSKRGGEGRFSAPSVSPKVVPLVDQDRLW